MEAKDLWAIAEPIEAAHEECAFCPLEDGNEKSFVITKICQCSTADQTVSFAVMS